MEELLKEIANKLDKLDKLDNIEKELKEIRTVTKRLEKKVTSIEGVINKGIFQDVKKLEKRIEILEQKVI